MKKIFMKKLLMLALIGGACNAAEDQDLLNVKDTQRLLEQINDQLGTLCGSKDKLNDLVGKMPDAINAAKARNQALTGQLEQTKEQLSKKGAEKGKSLFVAGMLKKAFISESSKHEKWKGKTKELRVELTQTQQKLGITERLLSYSGNLINKFIKESKVARTMNADLEQKLNNSIIENENLKNNLDQLINNLNGLQEQLAKQTNINEDEAKQIEELNVQINKLNTEIVNITGEKDAAIQSGKDVQKVLDESTSQVNQLNDRVKVLEGRIRAFVLQNAQLVGELSKDIPAEQEEPR